MTVADQRIHGLILSWRPASSLALRAPLSCRSLRLAHYQFFAVIAFNSWMSSAWSTHHLFEPPVFVLQLAGLLHITHFEPRIFRPPYIKGGASEIPCLRQSPGTPMSA